METFIQFSESNDWLRLWPEILLCLIAMAVLLMEGCQVKECYRIASVMAVGGLALVLAGTLIDWQMLPTSNIGSYALYFSGMLLDSPLTPWYQTFLFTASLLAVYLSFGYFKRRCVPRSEYLSIMLITTAAMSLLSRANHLLMVFVSLETVAVCFYVLIAFDRSNVRSLEAGLKYLLMGALSSAILLFGIVLLYGAASDPNLQAHSSTPLNFSDLGFFLSENPNNMLALVGASLVLTGICFKLGAVPFHIWVADVYQGAPTPTTALLAVSSKAAGVFVLYNLLQVPFAVISDITTPLMGAVAATTILLGNLTALPQRDVKRLIGYSGMSHAGFLIIGVLASLKMPWATGAVLFYLWSYLLASAGIFMVMNRMEPKDDSLQKLEDYQDLYARSRTMGLCLSACIGSLAGIPPLAGFIAKFMILVAAFKANLIGLAGIAVVGSVLGVAYYFGWIRMTFFFTQQPKATQSAIQKLKLHPLEAGLVSLLILGILFLGLFPTGTWYNIL